ncbi:MAG TPA: MAPEG family protein [Phenylobacterium sp.]|jgi:hypothetical protein
MFVRGAAFTAKLGSRLLRLSATRRRGLPMTSPILQPAIALVLWTFVMWAWLYATRIPAIVAAKKPMDPAMTAADLNAFIPPHVRWKADNYNHLHEQPTLFYAVAITLAVVGAGSGLNLWLAWAYVAIRVVHSLIQALGNVIPARFGVFMAGSLVLLALSVRAAMAVFGVG